MHRGQLQGQLDWQRRTVGFTHELVQGQFFNLQVISPGDFLGYHQVKAGLSFPGVGDGGGADLKIALGRCQLFGDSGFLRQQIGQAVLGGQHIEVGGADFHDQVLLGGEQFLFFNVNLALALLEDDLVARAVQGLGAAQGSALNIVAALFASRQGVVYGAD